VKWSAEEVAEVPAELLTVRSTVPAACAGATAVNCVSLSMVKLLAGRPPKSTPVALRKPVPVTRTTVPPAVLPEETPRTVTVGALTAVQV
jgi:hypothetical protein